MQFHRLFIELIPCLSAGYLIGRYKQKIPSQIALHLIQYGIPISLMGLLLKSGLDWRFWHSAILALFSIGILIALILLFRCNKKHSDISTLLLGSAFGNSGYFGVPVALAVLPKEALSISIGYDLGATLFIWSIGSLLMSQAPSSRVQSKIQWNQIFLSLGRSPASKGFLGALLLQLTPWSEQLASFLWIPSRIVIGLALLVVGMRIGLLNVPNNSSFKGFVRLITPSLIAKLLILPALMLGISTTFALPIVMRNALVLQASTPTAISVLLLAEASNGDQQELAASLVMWSTLLAVFTIPAWLLILQYLS